MASHQELKELSAEATRLTALLEPIPAWLSVPLEFDEGWWDKPKLQQALAHIRTWLARPRNEEAVQQEESLLGEISPIIERYVTRAVQQPSRRAQTLTNTGAERKPLVEKQFNFNAAVRITRKTGDKRGRIADSGNGLYLVFVPGERLCACIASELQEDSGDGLPMVPEDYQPTGFPGRQ